MSIYGTTMNRINLDDTRFIYSTNFSGDPARDRFGDDRRKCNIIIPSEEQAKDMTKAGFKVKSTRPRENDDPNTFVPEYYVVAQVKYRKRDKQPVKYPPMVYLVTGNNQPVALNEETVGCLDQIRVKNVNAILSPYQTENGGLSLYVRTMYVEQDMDDDPYRARYARPAADEVPPYDDEDEAPF